MTHMLAMLRKTVYSVIFFSVACAAMGQVATGTYPYGTFDNQGLDTINVGNLNVHISFPVLNKTGRGLPFFYNLVFDSSVWYPTSVNGSQVWTPVQNFGWAGQSQIVTGYLTYSQMEQETVSPSCKPGDPGNDLTTTISNVVYHDGFGIGHPFDGRYVTVQCHIGGTPITSTIKPNAADGSGYVGDGTNDGLLLDSRGRQFTVPTAQNGSGSGAANSGLGSITDSNGNQITLSGSGQFTDTTGKVVLTAAGAAPNPQTFTYTDSSGSPRAVTVSYLTHTVQTAFNCSGIGEYGPTSIPLVDKITFADGRAYTFSYEATPNGSGNVTGRLKSVQFPQGGTINYTYSGGSNGIECADGSAAGLTRSFSANDGSAASTWTYTRTITGTGTSTTAVVDGLKNNKTYTFVEASNQPGGTTAQYYETSRSVYQGAASGTPVLARNTCYDGSTSPCTTSTFALPISNIVTYESLNGSGNHGTSTFYNAFGLPTTVDIFDFGSAAFGPLLRKEVLTYGTSIANLVTEDQVFDGSSGTGNLSGQTIYSYDTTAPVASSGVPQHVAVSGPRGNLNSVVQSASSGASYTSSFTYEDTGSLLSSTTPSGKTTLSYDPTFVYNTGVSLPTPTSGVPLSLSAAFDTANTGLPLNSTDPNSQVTKIPTYDSVLRPKEIDYPDGGKTTLSYTATEVTVNTLQTSSTSVTSEVQLDGLGRTSRTQVANGQSGPTTRLAVRMQAMSALPRRPTTAVVKFTVSRRPGRARS